MKRNLEQLGERVENLAYGLIAGALFAITATAFAGVRLTVPAQRVEEIVQVRLEGLVVTPTRTYRASEWALRRASADEVVLAPTDSQLRQCRLPQPSRPAKTLLC